MIYQNTSLILKLHVFSLITVCTCISYDFLYEILQNLFVNVKGTITVLTYFEKLF